MLESVQKIIQNEYLVYDHFFRILNNCIREKSWKMPLYNTICKRKVIIKMPTESVE